MAVPHVPRFKTLDVHFPVGNQPDQVAMWSRGLALFRKEFPFIHVHARFDGQSDLGMCGDVYLTSVAGMRDHGASARALRRDLLAKVWRAEDCPRGMLDVVPMDRSGALLGLPLLRNPTMLAANRRLLEFYGLADEPVETPGDLFRLGCRLHTASQGRVRGLNYPDYSDFGAFYGIVVSVQDGVLTFDSAKMRRFLCDLQPHSQSDDFQFGGCDQWEHFLTDRLGLYCWYWQVLPELQRRMPDCVPFHLPLTPDGFAIEGAAVGCVPATCRHPEEATLLLGFLGSEAAQRAMVGEAPYWLSVHKPVLAWQEESSPYPRGSVQYRYDPRSHYTQIDAAVSHGYAPRANTEIAKFCTGMQNLDETLERLMGLSPTV